MISRVILLGIVFLIAQNCSSGPEPYNVILVINDAWRQDSLGCYNPASPNSPRIDAFARDAVLFKRAVAQSPNTINSAPSILCSVYPSEHGYFNYNRAISSDLTTIAEAMKKMGYKTFAVSTNPHISKRNNLAQGFDTFIESHYWKDAPSCAEVNRTLKDWLVENRGGKFFAMLWTIDTHVPYKPPQEFIEKYIAEEDRRLISEKTISPKGKKLSVDEQRISRGLYNASVNYFDSEFGKLLDFLDEKDLSERTVVILTSDHGEAFWENIGPHGKPLVGHGNSLHREEIHIPLIVNIPDIKQGRIIEQLAQHMDIFPTLLDVLGAGSEIDRSNFGGDSLYPVIKKRKMIPRGHVFIENITDEYKGLIYMQGIQSREFKLVMTKHHEGLQLTKPVFKLFALNDQESELDFNKGKSRVVFLEMRGQLAAWQRSLKSKKRFSNQIKFKDQEEKERVERTLRTLGYIK